MVGILPTCKMAFAYYNLGHCRKRTTSHGCFSLHALAATGVSSLIVLGNVHLGCAGVRLAAEATCGRRIAPDVFRTVSPAAPVSFNVAHLVLANSASRAHRCFRLPRKTREEENRETVPVPHRKEGDQRQTSRHGAQSSTENSVEPVLLRAILERLRR